MTPANSALSIALTSLLAAGCGPISGEDGFVGGDGGRDGRDAGVDAQTVCDEQDFSIDRQPTKLLLALDMSGSMVSKYTSARNGIVNAITNLSGQFHLGFNSYPMYPYSAQCGIAPDVLFDTAPGNETNILNWLNTHEPQTGAGDPLVVQIDALLNGVGYATNFTSPAVPGETYLVIVSDGDDCCGPAPSYSCSNQWTTELVDRTERLLLAGIKTVVVGYAGADDATMTAIALAGGSPFSTYLPANDETALQGALETIGAAVVGCSFAVDVPSGSTDQDAVNLYFDNVLLPYEPGCASGMGWDWADPAHTTVELCAGSCDQLREGTIDNVTAKFGCPSVQID
ncbi:MAG: VWA domain-containing protein [Myxococcales bacterium]|nr:VWA domain-containing protein [Myxococcales bacterium]